MGHLLDDMLAHVKVVRDGAVEAYLDPYDYSYGWGAWERDISATEVALARMIFGQERVDVEDGFWSSGIEADWPEDPKSITDEWLEAQAQGAEPADDAIITRAWLLSLDGLLRGCETPLVPRDTLFSVGFLVDGGATSWAWGWRVVALTEQLAAFNHWAEGCSGCLPVLRGFVNRLDLFRSTALLLRHHKLDGDGFVGDSFWSEMSCSGIPLPELYRLLLASAGRGGPDLFRLDGDGLVNYREPGMRHGFRDVERLVSSGK